MRLSKEYERAHKLLNDHNSNKVKITLLEERTFKCIVWACYPHLDEVIQSVCTHIASSQKPNCKHVFSPSRPQTSATGRKEFRLSNDDISLLPFHRYSD